MVVRDFSVLAERLSADAPGLLCLCESRSCNANTLSLLWRLVRRDLSSQCAQTLASDEEELPRSVWCLKKPKTIENRAFRAGLGVCHRYADGI